MKRSVPLQPLSRQHHNGLLAVLLLRKGLARNAETGVLLEFVRWIWQKDLQSHFEQEETVLLPLLREHEDFPQSLNDELLNDHVYLRRFVEETRQGRVEAASLRDWVDRLDRHIRFEERTHFPRAEAVLSREELERIGEQLQEGEASNCMNYPVKFWE